MTIKMLIAGSLAALALGTTAAHADDALTAGSLDAVLERGAAYGFTHYLEIESKERGQVALEGWLDEEWQAEVRLSLESGELYKESRKRRDDGPWGMSEAEVRLAMEVAVAEGMAEFEEIEFKRDDLIKVEGRDEDGRELEVTTRRGEEEALKVERD